MIEHLFSPEGCSAPVLHMNRSLRLWATTYHEISTKYQRQKRQKCRNTRTESKVIFCINIFKESIQQKLQGLRCSYYTGLQSVVGSSQKCSPQENFQGEIPRNKFNIAVHYFDKFWTNYFLYVKKVFLKLFRCVHQCSVLIS